MIPIKTKRWDDPTDADDGTRILVCRYRPRGVAKADETWAEWRPELGPSKALHAAAYGKGGTHATWETYRRAYLKEMLSQAPAIAVLASRVRQGEAITLLCSSACDRESRCHRSLLRELIEQAVPAKE
ncbi:MAG: hypothetical protein JWM57_977 [Phycisphaerales bacterium]|nr:hypothetical protein [Phycisphaerales bacterium]